MSRPIYDQNQGGYRIFIGNLSSRTNESEVQKECERYGSLINCWVARNPPGFAFVVYKHGDDAASAVRNMDGCIFAGQRIRVEHAKARVVNSRNAPTYRDRENGARRSRRRSSDSRSRSRSNSREHSKKKSSRRRHKHRSSSSGNEKSHRTKSKSPNGRSGENEQSENSD